MKSFKILLAAATGWLLSGCSTDTAKCSSVNQNEIYQTLSADYDATTNKTTARVYLRFGGSTGTTLELDGKCALTHSSYTLSRQNFLGTSYTGDGIGPVLSHTFVFTDNDSRTYTNSGSLSAISLSSPPATISKSTGATINFTPMLLNGETARVFFSSNNDSSVASAQVSVTAASSVTVTGENLVNLATGVGKIWIERQNSVTPTAVTSKGGNFLTSYASSKSNITINP